MPTEHFRFAGYGERVVRSIFSRNNSNSGAVSYKKPAAHTNSGAKGVETVFSAGEDRSLEPKTYPTHGPLVREAAVKWRAELTEATRKDAETGPAPRVSLGAVHPGGMAQLYADRPTRLSNLVREVTSYERAADALDGILIKAQALSDRYGSAAIHLVIGIASWGGERPAKAVPALLRQIVVDRESDGDFTLRIKSGVEVSNRLLDAFARVGRTVDAETLVRRMITKNGFSPAPALKAFREVGRYLPDFELHETLSVGIYVHPASSLLRELGAPQALSLSPLVRALAGDKTAQGELDVQLADPNPFDRDPWHERGLGDQSVQIQDAIEAATNNDSVFVNVAPNADEVATAVSIAAEHAARGKHVMMVTANRGLRQRLKQQFVDYGVDEIAALVEATEASDRAFLSQLRRAINGLPDVVNQDEIDSFRARLHRIREQLSRHVRALHEQSPAWGVSAYDALQVLSELTSLPDGPSTKVRVSQETLTSLSLDAGEQARELLAEAEDLGMFAPSSGENAWRGAKFTSTDQVEQVLAALERLNVESLPTIMRQMEETHKQTGLPKTNTLAQWAKTLQVLSGVRDSLRFFNPEVFEHSAADMITATASKQWRNDRGIKLKRSQKRQLIHQVEQLAKPGVELEQIHEQLLLVQARREDWLRVCEAETWPRLPKRFDDMLKRKSAVDRDLDIVGRYVSDLYGDLRTLPMNELVAVLDRLYVESDSARLIPKRFQVRSALQKMGLSEFLDDMAERRIHGENLGHELDLCWWASTLTEMISSEPDLGGFDPSALQEMLEQERELDKLQVDSLGAVLLQKVRRLRASALSLHPEQGEHLTRTVDVMLETQSGSVAQLYANCSLVWDLLPIAIVGQSLVPQMVPWGTNVDVVVLCGANESSLAELVPVISRAKQVIVVGDAERAAADSISVQMGAILPQTCVQPGVVRVNDQINLLLSKYVHSSSGVSVPGRKTRGLVTGVWCDATGTPALGSSCIETSEVEAQTVLKVVEAVARGREAILLAEPSAVLPSMAVIALTERHASRIQDLLTERAKVDPVLRKLVESEGVEPFVVVGPEQGARLQRDHIILSFGFAKTPHGRVIHDFGRFSQANAITLLAQILSASRSDLTVVSSLRSYEIDGSRLHRDSERLLLDLLKLADSSLDVDELVRLAEERLASADNLLADLAHRLDRIGMRVVPRLGSLGGMQIPLAIGHPEVPDELLVAILTDDARYLAEPSLRARDRYWPELLEEQGWKVRTELSMAVFIDPNREAERIVQLALDGVDDYYVARGRPETPNAAIALGYLQDEDQEVPEQPVSGVAVFYGQTAEDVEQTGIIIRGEKPAKTGSVPVVSTNTRMLSVVAGNARSERPAIAAGLPLSAYSDDQLDEIALWIRSDGVPRSIEEMMEEIRSFLELTRRGVQSDAVLRNVALRTEAATKLAPVDVAADTSEGEQAKEAESGVGGGVLGDVDDAGDVDGVSGVEDGIESDMFAVVDAASGSVTGDTATAVDMDTDTGPGSNTGIGSVVGSETNIETDTKTNFAAGKEAESFVSPDEVETK